MTIREALDEKRSQLAGKVKSLVLCKNELFYIASGHGSLPEDTVYPVALHVAEKEAIFFGVKMHEE